MSLLYFGNSTFLAHGSFFLFFDPRITFAWSPSIISCPCLAVLMFVCPHSFGVSYLHVTISAPLRIYIFTYQHAYILSLFPHSVFSYYPTNLFWVPEINCYGCPLPYCVFLFSLEGYFAIISPRFYARMFSYLDFNISTCLHISMITWLHSIIETVFPLS